MLNICIDTSFADIDECSLEGTCVPEADCTNSIGSFSCVCRTGFTGNETYCEGKASSIQVAVEFCLGWQHKMPVMMYMIKS